MPCCGHRRGLCKPCPEEGGLPRFFFYCFLAPHSTPSPLKPWINSPPLQKEICSCASISQMFLSQQNLNTLCGKGMPLLTERSINVVNKQCTCYLASLGPTSPTRSLGTPTETCFWIIPAPLARPHPPASER